MIDDVPAGAETGVEASTPPQQPALTPAFARHGLEQMSGFAENMHNLEEALLDIESFGGREAEKKAEILIQSAHEFEPSITMIGQIKSGKTSLVNAMAGRPELLPADVNPWTSVVTSLHLNTQRKADDPVASFRFFDKGEWDFLVENGGRIGELSSRAGADEELVKVREQIAEMREKTKARLGKKFELLLGQTHNYRHLDEELMQRYVCMGDDFGDPDMLDAQGQFADITKSADLYLDAPSLPMPLCIRDTPGVNDTFMMREQITINALRGSRICVVVLSANQALSSMDMGLIRLISNIDSREVVVFVNRIDELPNPAEQIDEIRESILKTLADNNGPSGLHLVFGSAYWANMALQETIDDLVPDSAASLQNFATSRLGEGAPITPADVWDMSGLPALYDAISERINVGEGAQVITALRKRALNHLHGLKASSNIVSMRIDNQDLKIMEPDVLAKRLDEIEDRHMAGLDAALKPLFEAYTARIDQAHKRFLDRALESLLQHLEKHGDKELWQYSPEGLRMLLRSSYHSMCKKTANTCVAALNSAADDLSGTYRDLLSIEVEGFSVSAPSAPSFPPPVSLGQTIALDLQSSWWKGWWQRRKGYRAYADSFYELIEAETAPILNDMKTVQVAEIRRIALAQLEDFLLEQGGILTDVSNKSQISVGELKGLFGITAQEEREAIFDILFDEFSVGPDIEETADPDPQPARPTRPTRPHSKASLNKGEAA
jgi:GTP-binding protein EngB required for normal cell division